MEGRPLNIYLHAGRPIMITLLRLSRAIKPLWPQSSTSHPSILLWPRSTPQCRQQHPEFLNPEYVWSTSTPKSRWIGDSNMQSTLAQERLTKEFRIPSFLCAIVFPMAPSAEADGAQSLDTRVFNGTRPIANSWPRTGLPSAYTQSCVFQARG